ncbi:hypothetical protein IEQ34_018850 [Dendrobium chrysotoxum]|uniref:Uncharacterized protein n=1 Tax=Dendrobium chrysotoxum TaxID=161865 RepID=A0AAV7G5T2_DENCH|nr:hypothetical protein IEQ34_018850 [Dendrobium chrysotoxum]
MGVLLPVIVFCLRGRTVEEMLESSLLRAAAQNREVAENQCFMESRLKYVGYYVSRFGSSKHFAQFHSKFMNEMKNQGIFERAQTSCEIPLRSFVSRNGSRLGCLDGGIRWPRGLQESEKERESHSALPGVFARPKQSGRRKRGGAYLRSSQVGAEHREPLGSLLAAHAPVQQTPIRIALDSNGELRNGSESSFLPLERLGQQFGVVKGAWIAIRSLHWSLGALGAWIGALGQPGFEALPLSRPHLSFRKQERELAVKKMKRKSASLASIYMPTLRRYNPSKLKTLRACSWSSWRTKKPPIYAFIVRGGMGARCSAYDKTGNHLKAPFRRSRRTGKSSIHAFIARGGMETWCGAYNEAGQQQKMMMMAYWGVACWFPYKFWEEKARSSHFGVSESQFSKVLNVELDKIIEDMIDRAQSPLLAKVDSNLSPQANTHPRSIRYPWTKQPMAVDNDPFVREIGNKEMNGEANNLSSRTRIFSIRFNWPRGLYLALKTKRVKRKAFCWLQLPRICGSRMKLAWKPKEIRKTKKTHESFWVA